MHCVGLPEVTRRCRPILYGPANAIAKIGDRVGIPAPINVQDIGDLSLDQLTPGNFNRDTGHASFLAVEQAVHDTLAGVTSGIVTGPIQKEAWHAAGIRYPGHTEYLADRLDVQDYCMMLTSEDISCVLATIHIPLADVSQCLTTQSVLRAIRLGADALARRLRRPAQSGYDAAPSPWKAAEHAATPT